MSTKHKIVFGFTFLLMTFLYNLAIPLDVLLFDSDLPYGNDPETIFFIRYFILTSLSIIGFFLGLNLVNRILPKLEIKKSYTSFGNSVNSYKILLLSVIVFFVIFYSNSLVTSIGSYSGNSGETYSNSGYAFAKEVLFFTISVGLFLLLRKRIFSYISLLCLFIIVLFGVLTNDKDIILLAFIPYIYYVVNRAINFKIIKKIKILNLSVLFFLCVTFAIIVNVGIYIYRNTSDNIRLSYLKESRILQHFDGQGPFRSACDIIEREPDYLFGSTYYFSFVSWIPKNIYQNRPESLSEQYAKEKYGKSWIAGSGFGFSLIAEAYMNFGIAGGFIQYLMIGLMLGGLGWLTRWLFKGLPTIYADSVFYVFAMYNIVIMHRGQFNLPSAYIRYILPFYCAYLVFDKWKLHTWFWKQITTTFVKR